MVVTVGFVMADEVACRIEKIDGTTATCQKYTKAAKGKKAEKEGDSWTCTINADTKIYKGMFNKDTKKVEKSDTAIDLAAFKESVTKAGDKGGVSVILTTDKDGGKGKATQILTVGGGKGKKAAAE
jgi:hypothetical protein